MTGATNFKERLNDVQKRILNACRRSGRDSSEITLLAVSKTFPFARIEKAFAAGQVDFGENYIQDCLTKMEQARERGLNLRWHFIGHLQSNKVKYYNPDFHLFHGLDSEKLAHKIAAKAQAGNFQTRVLIQVNIGDEPGKAGISAASLFDFIDKVRYIDRLSVAGLMAIPPAVTSAEASRPFFKEMNNLFVRLKADFFKDCAGFKHLSMGMSKDFEVAVEEGATIVRVGSLLFGERKKGKF